MFKFIAGLLVSMGYAVATAPTAATEPVTAVVFSTVTAVLGIAVAMFE